MEFVGVSDLHNRWNYTRQGIHKVVARADFPQPAFCVNDGRVKVWNVEDVERFELYHPELKSESYKTQKQVGYYRAKMKGPQGVSDAPPTRH